MYLNERVGNTWQKWGIDVLYTDVLNTLELSESKNLTVTAGACLAIIDSEKNKMRRRDEWKAKQKK